MQVARKVVSAGESGAGWDGWSGNYFKVTELVVWGRQYGVCGARVGQGEKRVCVAGGRGVCGKNEYRSSGKRSKRIISY